MFSQILVILGLLVLYILSVIAIHFCDIPIYRVGKQAPALTENEAEVTAPATRDEATDPVAQPSVEKAAWNTSSEAIVPPLNPERTEKA